MATLTFDKDNQVMEVALPDVEITIQEIVDQVRDFEDDLTPSGGMDIPHILSAAGKQPLGGSSYVGMTITLIDWTLKFADRPGPDWVTCNVSGGNLVAYDSGSQEYVVPISPAEYVNTNITASSSATLQEQTSIQHSSYDGGVHIDITSSYAGTTFPVGTPLEPVNNVPDAVTIANERGFDTLYIIGNITFTTGHDISNMTIVGQDVIHSTIIIEDGAVVTNCLFSDAYISGILDGGNMIGSSRIGTLEYLSGYVKDSLLENATITLGGTGTAHFLNCWSGVPGTGTPVIDMGATGQALGFRGYNGGIKIQNKSGSESASIDMISGQVILDSTVTNGDIVVRGVCNLTDNSTGSANVISDGVVNPEVISDYIWDEPMDDHSIPGSFGEWVKNKLLDVGKFVGLKDS